MYKVINKQEFIDAFDAYGRGDQFSYNGLCHLWDLLYEFTTDDNCAPEIDVIAICCEFTELSWDDVRSDYSDMLESDEDNAQLLDWLNDNTFVVYSDNDNVLFSAF